jgi:hypothetical protein
VFIYNTSDFISPKRLTAKYIANVKEKKNRDMNHNVHGRTLKLRHSVRLRIYIEIRV